MYSLNNRKSQWLVLGYNRVLSDIPLRFFTIFILRGAIFDPFFRLALDPHVIEVHL